MFDRWKDVLHSSPWCAYGNAIPVPVQVHDNSPATLPRSTRASEAARLNEHTALRVALDELLGLFLFFHAIPTVRLTSAIAGAGVSADGLGDGIATPHAGRTNAAGGKR